MVSREKELEDIKSLRQGIRPINLLHLDLMTFVGLPLNSESATNSNNHIGGPCPGLNTAANHNFLSHDGITTFKELVDAQQNLYNVGYDLPVTLAVLGLTITDEDIVAEKLSIGCDATTRTSYSPLLTGSEPGLDGHNKFESDTPLTRDDYFLAD